MLAAAQKQNTNTTSLMLAYMADASSCSTQSALPCRPDIVTEYQNISASETCSLAIILLPLAISWVIDGTFHFATLSLFVIYYLFWYISFVRAFFGTSINDHIQWLSFIPLCLWHVNESKIFHFYYFVILMDCLVYFSSKTNCELKKWSYWMAQFVSITILWLKYLS